MEEYNMAKPRININLKIALPAALAGIILIAVIVIYLVSINSPDSDIYVDVVGAVEKPGVVVLPEGSRVMDAIDAAGGLTDDADTSPLNKAAKLSDGDKLYVPTKDETTGSDLDKDKLLIHNSPDAKININTADAKSLMELYNIGESTAKNIIDYRESHGHFKKIEDIQNVTGIGAKTYDKIKELITITECK
jgi:competence protein ComEA